MYRDSDAAPDEDWDKFNTTIVTQAGDVETGRTVTQDQYVAKRLAIVYQTPLIQLACSKKVVFPEETEQYGKNPYKTRQFTYGLPNMKNPHV